jgi:DNA/RNA-binding domain of Phe-tRNA-synthetase-like protein
MEADSKIVLESHPRLDAIAFTTEFPRELAEMPSPEWLVDLLRIDAPAKLHRSEEMRTAIRELLRHGGYKPTGRGKPASEYLVRAAQEGTLGSINAAVDACNVVSLHGGIPISVVDAALLRSPLRVGIARDGAKYAFNAAGQEIDVEGLLCLHDGEGPCANAVKDAQRTKTSGATRATLSILWGTTAVPGATARAAAWYRELLGKIGAATDDVLFA